MYSLSSPGKWLGGKHLWFGCWCKCSVSGMYQDAQLVCFAEKPHKEATVPFLRRYKLFSIWVDREIFIQGYKNPPGGHYMEKKKEKRKKKEMSCCLGKAVLPFWHFIRHKFESNRSPRDMLLAELQVKAYCWAAWETPCPCLCYPERSLVYSISATRLLSQC